MAQAIRLEVGELGAGGVRIEALSVDLSARPEPARLRIGALEFSGQRIEHIEIVCADLSLREERMRCPHGELRAAKLALPQTLAFSLDYARGEFEVELRGAHDERWRVRARTTPTHDVAVDLAHVALSRLLSLAGQRIKLPSDWPQLGKGVLDGTLYWRETRGVPTLSAQLRLTGVAFADPSGLHAADALGATLKLDAVRASEAWHWTLGAGWDTGELLWQPLYVAGGGMALYAQGVATKAELVVERATWSWPPVGSVNAKASWSVPQSSLAAVELDAHGLDLGGLFNAMVKPTLATTPLAELSVAGKGNVRVAMRDGRLTAAALRIAEGQMKEPTRGIALENLVLDLPWDERASTTGTIAWRAASYGAIPFGATQARLALDGEQVHIDTWTLPLLDGALTLQNFNLRWGGPELRWDVGAQLTPISLGVLTTLLHWPTLPGSVSANLPRLRYENKKVQVDGGLTIDAFGGVITGAGLALEDPLGRSPRFVGDFGARGLDLEQMTGAFSFGRITGKVDVDVTGLELTNWQPTRLDARLVSSPGEYRKRISQRAVQNIAALGGSSATAAIQRSMLSFFEEFGYARLGLSCRLRGTVCEMDGIKPAPGGYVMVEGGGIPALTVIGYNRAVGWSELVERLQRVIQSNTKPVIQ